VTYAKVTMTMRDLDRLTAIRDRATVARDEAMSDLRRKREL